MPFFCRASALARNVATSIAWAAPNGTTASKITASSFFFTLISLPDGAGKGGAGACTALDRAGPRGRRAADAAAARASGRGDGGARGGDERPAVVGILAADILALDRLLGLLAVQGLIFEEGAGEAVELVEMLGEDAAGGRLGFLDQAADLAVD